MEQEVKVFTKVCVKCGRELPITDFRKTRWGGRADTCCHCIKEALQDSVANKKAKAKEEATSNALSRFTARELMEELAKRGYQGKLTYTEVHEIDIQNF